MKKNEIIRKMSAFHSEKWEFVIDMLKVEVIEKIAEEYAYASEAPSRYEEFGFKEEEPKDYVANCIDCLVSKASKEMWKQISKEQANDLLKVLYNTNVVNIKMRDGFDYTPEMIISSWKSANEAKDEEVEI